MLCEQHIASERAENNEHAGNDPSSNDDNEEGFDVEIDDTNVTTFRMTGTNRDSNEPANEIADPLTKWMRQVI